MITDYKIQLNFLPFASDLPDFIVYRRLKQNPQEPQPADKGIRTYSLPHNPASPGDRGYYWVSLKAREGFEECRISPAFNNDLTKWVLFQCLCASAQSKLGPGEIVAAERGFLSEVRFPLEWHSEGQEELIVQPYFLRTTRSFGFLVDFHFRLSEGAQFSRKVQQLSLSLDKHFKRNLDYYADRMLKVNEFVNRRWSVLNSIFLPGVNTPIELSRDFTAVKAERLHPRLYVFAGGKESRSQFKGLKDYGPLTPPKSSPLLLFVFREEDRQAARTLAMALKGSAQRTNFPGFLELFGTELKIDSNPVVVDEFSVAAAKLVLDRVRSVNNTIVPVFVLPDKEGPGYFEHKAVFAREGIATQVCTVPIIHDENALRWSVANIALQIFCKAGGWPWKVRCNSTRSLIIGISQSHRVRKIEERTSIEKYFAFSVLTDNSGLFQNIQVLSEENDEGTYLDHLKASLLEVLKLNASDFDRIVIHTSFKLKRKEINTIQEVVREAEAESGTTGCQFAVLKVNQKNRFFGFNPLVNSLVPFEGTLVRLGRGEYLVWFEGVFPDRTTVTKAFPGPTHIEILKVSDYGNIRETELLQDLMNLSGANWRGFNAKSAPISVFYCHLLADLVQEFHDHDLPMPPVKQLRPWFL